MGLDSVELVMAVEDTFQITIENEEAEKILTVGELYNLVLEKLQGTDNKICLTSAAFYRVRRAIMKALGCKRTSISLSTSLEKLLPQDDRRKKWRQIQQEMTLDLPDLILPEWIFLSCAGAGIFLSLIECIHHKIEFVNYLVCPLMGFIAGIFFYVLLAAIAKPLAIKFPNDSKTVGDLAEHLRDKNFGRLSQELGGWNKDEVLNVLRRLIVKQLGVSTEKLELDARFVDDLGMN
jgi:acyl carrier protein